MENKTYISIDLKSFFASVECVARGLDPLRTNLVVADSSHTEKNHMSCGHSVAEIIRNCRQSQNV